MPSLRELDAHFVKCVAVRSTEQDADGKYVWRDEQGEIWMWSPTPDRYEHHWVDTLEEAHGLWFDCPICKDTNGHHVLVGFEGRDPPYPLSHGSNGPTKWNVSGTSLDDLVLTPSILLLGGCNWHGFVGSNGVPPGHAA